MFGRALTAIFVLVSSVFAPPIVYMVGVDIALGEMQNINEGISALLVLLFSLLGAVWFAIGSLILRRLMLRNLMLYSVALSVVSGIYAINLGP